MAATGKEAVSLEQLKAAFDNQNGKISELKSGQESKLDMDDLVAGANITIDKTSQPGKAVIIGADSTDITIAPDSLAKGYLGY